MVTLCKPANLLISPAGCTVTHQEIPLVFLLSSHALFMDKPDSSFSPLQTQLVNFGSSAAFKLELELSELFEILLHPYTIWRNYF